MIKVALASLRFRLAAFLATFLAVLLGCALLIACGGLFETAIRLNAAPQRLGGAPIVVTGSAAFPLPSEESESVAYVERSGVDFELLDKIAAIPGVKQAIPDVSFPAVVIKDNQVATSGNTTLSGHDWRAAALTPYELSSGNAPQSRGQVVLDATSAQKIAVKPGDTITVAVNGQPQTFTVTGIAQAKRHIDAAALFFASADMRIFSTRAHDLDAIGVLPADGVTATDVARRLTKELPPEVSILTGDDRGAAEFNGINASRLPLILLSSIFGGMVMVVMGLVVWATISLSVRQRQRELALLRATGATPKQVRQLIVAETMIVSVLAIIGGVFLGRLVGGWIFSSSTALGVLPAGLRFQQGIVPFAAGTLLSLLIPWIVVILTAGLAARVRPIQALSEATIASTSVNLVRRVLAVIFIAITLSSVIMAMFFDPDTAFAIGGSSSLTGAIAVALLGPELLDILVRKFTPFIRRFARKNGALAIINTRTRAVQFAAVLTPLTVAVAIALGNVYSQTTLETAALERHVEQFQADAVITSSAGGIAPILSDQIRNIPGVASVSELVSSQGWIEEPFDDSHGSDRWPLLGIRAQDQAPVLATSVATGSLRNLAGNTVALPKDSVEDLGIKLGDQVKIRLGDGARVKVKVVALLNSPTNYGSVILPAELLAPHTTTGLPSQLLVRAASGQDSSTLVEMIESQLETWPGTTVGDDTLLSSLFRQGMDVQAWITYLLAVLAIAYAAVASVNTLAVAVLSRRRELATQRLTGATRKQVTRMLYTESTIVAAIALIVGTVIALVGVVSIAIATGLILPAGPIWIYLAVAASVFLIVWSTTFFASHSAMRRKPIEVVNLQTE